MKKELICLLVLLCGGMSYAQVSQQCNLQGVVRYEYNDYVGYKIDVGAEIGVVPVSKADTVNYSTWQVYEDLAKRRTNYIMCENDEELKILGDANLRGIARFSHADEAKLDSILVYIMTQYMAASKLFECIGLVDASGRYSITLPYGEYYVFAKSANRVRSLLPERWGRLILKKVKIDRPAQVLNIDFSY